MKPNYISRGIAWLCAALFPFFMLSCKSTECDTYVAPGIVVNTSDAATGMPLCGVKAVITDGDYREEIEVTEGGCEFSSMRGADERTGTYHIVVSKDGYKDYVVESLEVFQEDVCHVDSQILEVNLERE